MSRSVLIVSHADADGHVIAEQVRRNVSLVPTFDVTTVIDSKLTRGHKAWTLLDEITAIETSEVVLFVDLMFAPASFAQEADALVRFASARPDKRFFILDHHPLPLRLLSRAPNIHASYHRDVMDCTFGSASWLMCVAALLEKQETRADAYVRPEHRVLAEGIRRAAAPGGPLPGQKLLALLRHECWNELIVLGEEERQGHFLPRGRRPKSYRVSGAMESLNKLATQLLRSGVKPAPRKPQPRMTMSYDFEPLQTIPSKVSDSPLSRSVKKPRGVDLEAIVTLLELAAMSLMQEPDASFTGDQLFDVACEIGGNDIGLKKEDVVIVLDKAAFLEKQKKNRYRLR